jgi:positive regulator of sigma E activity
LLGAGGGAKRVNAILSPNIEIHNGDWVSIVLEPRNLLRASVIVYGYPLLGAVLAALLALKLEMGDAAGAVAALAGLFSGMLIARIRLGKTRCLRDFTPVIVERLMPASAK